MPSRNASTGPGLFLSGEDGTHCAGLSGGGIAVALDATGLAKAGDAASGPATPTSAAITLGSTDDRAALWAFPACVPLACGASAHMASKPVSRAPTLRLRPTGGGHKDSGR